MKKRLFMFILIATFIIAMSYAQSITVTSPHSGQTWYKGNTYTITWTKSGSMDAQVKIRLYQGNTKVLNITDSTSNDGSYSWTIPSSVAPGTYYIRVKTTDNAVYDNSDEFTIADAPQSSITITAPHSGQTWCKGEAHTITWTKTGSMDANVKIRLYQGNTKVLNITDSTSNDGSYSWTVPNTLLDGAYFIRVKTIDNAVYDDSDAFTINASNSGDDDSGIHIDPWIIEKLKHARIVKIVGWGPHGPIGPDPGPCPQCINLDVSKIKEITNPPRDILRRGLKVSNPKIVMILFQGNEPIKELGVVETNGKTRFEGKFSNRNKNLLTVNLGKELGAGKLSIVFKNAQTGEIVKSIPVNIQNEGLRRR